MKYNGHNREALGIAFLLALSTLLYSSGCTRREYLWRPVSEVGMEFDCPCTLSLVDSGPKPSSIKEMTRYDGAFGNLIVVAQRLAVQPDIKIDLDARARTVAGRVVPGTDNHKIESIVPIAVSGMTGRKVSITKQIKGKPVGQEIVVVAKGQTIWELHVFHEREVKQVNAAKRMIGTLRIPL